MESGQIQVRFSGVKQLLLNSAVLEEHSTWFRNKIAIARGNGQDPIIFQLTPTNNDELPALELVVSYFPDIRRTTSLTSMQHDQTIKTEKNENDDPIQHAFQFVDLYEALFELFEGKHNKLKSIQISRLEILVTLADLYDVKVFVQQGIKEHFLQRPKELYEAIAQDPPRYLRFANKCEWKFMFRQALIHCAGGFPGRCWPTSIKSLDPSLQSVVIEKALQLSDWSRRTEVQLFMITFVDKVNGQTVSTTLGKGQRELINLFREWLVTQLLTNAEHPEPYERGVHYWRMFKRGDAYLPLTSVIEHFKSHLGPRHSFDVQKNLTDLKNEVQRAVRQISTHNLDFVGREEYGIDYLTCLDVEDSDYPWLVRSSI